MADLSKIKVGDKLRIEVEVDYVNYDGGYPIRVRGPFERQVWVDPNFVEHIPAPKTFKRGDRVRHVSEQHRGISLVGLVLCEGLEAVYVSWDYAPRVPTAVPVADLYLEPPDDAS